MSKMKFIFFVLILLIGNQYSFAQQKELTRKTFAGLHFFYYDFNTVMLSKSNSFTWIIQQKKWTKPIGMQSGFGIHLNESFFKNIDLSVALNAAWIDYPNKNGQYSNKNFFLIEIAPSLQHKMFKKNAIINPFLQTGFAIQASSKNFGLLADVGLGTNFLLFNESKVNTTIQYRYPLNNRVAGHFFYSIGVNTLLREKKISKKKTPATDIVIPYFEIDFDKDGVADIDDHCPNEAGIKELSGCPRKMEIVNQIDSSLSNKEEVGNEIVKSDTNTIELPKQQFIYFEFSKAHFLLSDTLFLNTVFHYLVNHKSVILHLYGHTDNVGSFEYNQKLSLQRCQSVESYLIKKGIVPSRIIIKGFGETVPLFSNKEISGRNKNRRVEFIYLNQ